MNNQHSHYSLVVWLSLVSAALAFFIVMIALNLLSVGRISLTDGWGSFAGGLVAATATITAFLVTNRENRRQFDELARINYLPIIDFEPCELENLEDFKRRGFIEQSPIDINRDPEKKRQKTKVLNLVIDNKGNGPARNLSLHYQYFFEEDQLAALLEPIIIKNMQANAGLILPLKLYGFNGDSSINIILNFEDIRRRQLDSGLVRIDYNKEEKKWTMYPEKFAVKS